MNLALSLGAIPQALLPTSPTFAGTITSLGGTVAPVYNNGGTQLGSGAGLIHTVIAPCQSSSNVCTLTLTGAAVFYSSATYACSGSLLSGSQNVNYIVNASASQVGVQFAAPGASNGVMIQCTGY